MILLESYFFYSLNEPRKIRDTNYQPGGYKTFEIYEPKRRIISAAPYRDRVVHHALCDIIAPIFEQYSGHFFNNGILP